MEVFLLWFVLAIAAGVFADNRGRSGLGWFFISVVFSPLIGFILLMIFPKQGSAAFPKDEMGRAISPDTHVRCPDCKELVRRDAIKCKHCSTTLIAQ